jgi:hypothetical protein
MHWDSGYERPDGQHGRGKLLKGDVGLSGRMNVIENGKNVLGVIFEVKVDGEVWDD